MTNPKKISFVERLLKLFFPTAKKTIQNKPVERWENEGGAIDKTKEIKIK